jgi:kynurenine formamidase
MECYSTRVILAGLALAAVAAAAPAIDPAKMVDLTYPFDEQTVNWPTAQPFRFEKEAWGPSAGGYWYSAGRYAASEHLGTHLDSPIHFAQGQATVDQIPVSHLVAPVEVVDVTAAAAQNRDYLVTAADLAAWEKRHGAIPARTIVLIRTGWSKFWPDKRRYLGTAKAGDTANLHFPGVAEDAARLLVQRGVYALGIDTASMDHGPSQDFMTHRVLNTAGIYGLENVGALDRLPATGATLIALPMKIAGGSGGPVRIVAVLP